MLFLVILLITALAYLLVKYSKLKKEYAKILDPEAELQRLKNEIAEAGRTIIRKNKEIDYLSDTAVRLERETETKRKKLQALKTLHEAVTYSIHSLNLLGKEHADLYDDLCPSILLRLHAMDSKELQKEFRANQKRIEDFVKESSARFDERYSNRAMSAVYVLTVIAMQSEVQNILHTIKYEELEKAETSVREITKKYYALAADATRTITGALSSVKAGKGQTIDDSLRKNITELEYLFLTSVRIEYTYYAKKEQAKAEQAALREQMRVEAAEKKALEAERQKIEKEEAKYQTEINKLSAAVSGSQSDDEKARLTARIAELQQQLSAVTEKKEEIVSRQNGKAGTVYIISNLGSFGEDVFKVGMTRRLEPQERVDELGDASVPFRFDVHSFIFSEDAVALETKLHTILAEKRVNKVNSRKEFFRIPIDELQALVYDVDPTATFSTTMAAEDYRQTLSLET